MQRLFLPGIFSTGRRLRTISRLFAPLLLAALCALSRIVSAATDIQSRPQAGLRNSDGGADFAELRGEREAVAAFDLGFAVLHELVHAVCGLRDSVGEKTELGECDELINQMRRELNLPERLGYGACVWTILSGPVGATMRAELVFARERAESGRARIERFYLYWDAKRVGGPQTRSMEFSKWGQPIINPIFAGRL